MEVAADPGEGRHTASAGGRVNGGRDTDSPVRYDRAGGGLARKKRRALYLVSSCVVSVVVVAGVIEAAGVHSLFGVDTTTVSASGGGSTVEVRYAEVTRAQLVVPLEITVNSPQGFADSIVISVSAGYLDPFLTQGPTPQPSSETSDGTDIIMTFDPPSGDTFAVHWNLTAEPVGTFTTAKASVSLRAGDQPIATAHLTTQIRP